MKKYLLLGLISALFIGTSLAEDEGLIPSAYATNPTTTKYLGYLVPPIQYLEGFVPLAPSYKADERLSEHPKTLVMRGGVPCEGIDCYW